MVEIILPSLRRHDRSTQLNLYQCAGVPAYRLVDHPVQTFVWQDAHYNKIFIPVSRLSGFRQSVFLFAYASGPPFEL